MATIRWEQAGEVLAEAMTGPGPAGELVVLALAVAVGTDRFGLSEMDTERQRQMLDCVRSLVREWTRQSAIVGGSIQCHADLDDAGSAVADGRVVLRVNIQDGRQSCGRDRPQDGWVVGHNPQRYTVNFGLAVGGDELGQPGGPKEGYLAQIDDEGARGRGRRQATAQCGLEFGNGREIDIALNVDHDRVGVAILGDAQEGSEWLSHGKPSVRWLIAQ